MNFSNDHMFVVQHEENKADTQRSAAEIAAALATIRSSPSPAEPGASWAGHTLSDFPEDARCLGYSGRSMRRHDNQVL